MDDLISRQQAIDAVEKSMSENPHENEIHRGMHDHEHRHFLTILMGLPSVQPDPCEDAVSRKAVLSMIDTYMNKSVELHYLPTSDGIKKLISILPIVTPKLRKETSDLISRTQAIYIASGYCHPANIATELAKLPSVQPEQRWIPVSERLPEECKVVLTQAKFKDDVKMAVSSRIDYNYWTGWGTRDINIIAWMPLPEPYRAGDEQESQ